MKLFKKICNLLGFQLSIVLELNTDFRLDIYGSLKSWHHTFGI
jgi:hypothetical protein